MRQALLILPAAHPSRVSSLPRRGKAGRHQTSGAQVMCSPLPTPSPPPWGPGFAEEALARLVWHKAPWFWPGAVRDGQEETFPPALWLKLSQQGEVGLDVPVLGQAALLARSSLLQQVGELWGCSHRLHPGKKCGPACTPRSRSSVSPVSPVVPGAVAGTEPQRLQPETAPSLPTTLLHLPHTSQLLQRMSGGPCRRRPPSLHSLASLPGAWGPSCVLSEAVPCGKK